MSSLILFLSFVYVLSTIDAFNKSIKLNNSHLGASGIGVIITANHVNTIYDIWHINPSTQDGTDIELQMNSEWGFHQLIPSTITLIIDGYTPNITKSDGEFLILFGVGNQHYFSIVIRLEDNTAWKSYPDYGYNGSQTLAYTNNIFMDLILTGQSNENRWNRISNNDQWTNIGYPDLYKDSLEWPLKVSITNDPIENQVYYQCYVEDRVLRAEYDTAFPTDQGLSVYIMNDASDGKPFDIYSIDVSYSYMTDSPTISPTVGPTQQPTNPTLTPTISPTTRALVVDGENQPGSTRNEDSVPENGVSTTRWSQIENVIVEQEDHDDTVFIVVIIILGVLLCIVSIVLIYKWLNNGTYLKGNRSRNGSPHKVKERKRNVNDRSLSPKSISINKYLEKQLAESIANSIDSPGRNQFIIIPGVGGSGSSASSASAASSGSSEDDSDEEMYRKGSMDTETTAFTIRDPNITLSHINIGSMSIIKDHKENNYMDDDKVYDHENEGTPDEILNINIEMNENNDDNNYMDGNESENQTMAIPMNPVISI